MKHVHADLMLLYAQDAQETDKPWERYEYQIIEGGKWFKPGSGISWCPTLRYRRTGQHFESAQDRAAHFSDSLDEEWLDIVQALGHRRKKLYKWLFMHETTKAWEESDYHESEEDVRNDILWGKHFKRLDYTMVEV